MLDNLVYWHPMIRKLRILFWTGIALLFVPFFGVHSSWKSILTVVIGVCVIYLAFTLRKEYKVLRFRLKRFEEPEVQAEIHTTTA